MHGRSSLVEAFVWLLQFLCVQRKRERRKKKEERRKKKEERRKKKEEREREKSRLLAE